MECSKDAFLNGQLQIYQPKQGYRAGVDAVLLAAAVPAVAGESVLELGCGVGVASLCLGARVRGLDLVGVEVQPDYADLARRNGHSNGIGFDVHTGDLSNMPPSIRQRSFDHVIANPPYYMGQSRVASHSTSREMAHVEQTPLSLWIDTATRRLGHRGRLTLIQRADRLRDVLQACDDRLGALTLWPIQARTHRPAQLFLLTAQKGGRTPLTIRNPLIMHEGAQHERDGESYTKQVRGVLRDGMALI